MKTLSSLLSLCLVKSCKKNLRTCHWRRHTLFYLFYTNKCVQTNFEKCSTSYLTDNLLHNFWLKLNSVNNGVSNIFDILTWNITFHSRNGIILTLSATNKEVRTLVTPPVCYCLQTPKQSNFTWIWLFQILF